MTGKLLVRLFALFGMTLTCVACYGVEYTEFNPEFGASGRVVDEQNNPIEGIEASSGGYVTYTDANGVTGTATAGVTINQDVIMYVPQPSIVPINVIAFANISSTIGSTITQFLTFSCSSCF